MQVRHLDLLFIFVVVDFTCIQKNIARHIALDADEMAYFNSILTGRRLHRREILLTEGQSCHYINYVHSGALRAYHLDQNGVENNIMFAVSDWWVTDMYAYISRQPAMLFIEAVAESEILQLRNDDLEKLYIAIPKFERFFRIIMQNSYIREQLRTIQNLSLPAETRYLNFIKKYPQFIAHIPQKQIASYIGITPEFLSAIRKKLRNG